MGFDIIVFGSLHLDIMVAAPDRPRRGETIAGHAWSLKPGGKGGNQAVQAQAAGARTAMIGAVGDDDFGRTLLQNLDAHSVDRSHVEVRKDAGSGVSVAIMDAEGDYGAVIISGANLALTAHDAEAAQPLFEGARWLLLQNEVPDAANVGAARMARRHGVRTILNAAPSRPFPEALEGLIDILVVNAIEADAMLAPAPGVDSLATATAAATGLLKFAESTIVTAGGIGVSLATRDGRTVEIPGHTVDLVSTHGAGDCFIGSLAAQLAGGVELEEATHYANAAAALHVSARTSRSAFSGKATLGDLLLELRAREPGDA
jgi:ribokinase